MIHKVVDIDSAKELGNSMSEVKGEVEFRNIEFEYPSRPGSLVLSRFNLKVMACQTVGLVGRSESGKSTEASMEEVMKAANAHNFICQLPEGYDTLEKWWESGSHEQLMQNLSCPISIMVQLQRNFVEVTSKAQDTGSSSSVVLDTEIANAEQKDNIQPLHSFCMASLLAVYLTTS
ncbi:ATP-BINDING CASSETTE SUB-FAMILY B [Salix viminalis]|uniref:ATP-BINDING CASSETTE SUB-FAMILY B n=1 Tax=Salix viminalis TaxID=40686 RepID=A0A9Q0ZPJ2_SALVM|nr:ATP-BINDING CASSETTE SUB-FAMILY B [Salix viminalis]